jgi:hypothetical protein
VDGCGAAAGARGRRGLAGAREVERKLARGAATRRGRHCLLDCICISTGGRGTEHCHCSLHRCADIGNRGGRPTTSVKIDSAPTSQAQLGGLELPVIRRRPRGVGAAAGAAGDGSLISDFYPSEASKKRTQVPIIHSLYLFSALPPLG